MVEYQKKSKPWPSLLIWNIYAIKINKYFSMLGTDTRTAYINQTFVTAS